MRTTLTIEDELLGQIEAIQRQKGLSFKATINSLLRDGLARQAEQPKPRPYRTKARELGLLPGIDPTKLNQLVDDLEIEAFGAGIPKP